VAEGNLTGRHSVEMLKVIFYQIRPWVHAHLHVELSVRHNLLSISNPFTNSTFPYT
jgi:hypothetical protein